MPPDPYLHELDDFPTLVNIVSDEKGVIPQLFEKDYWIMHCLYGLKQQGFESSRDTILNSALEVFGTRFITTR